MGHLARMQALPISKNGEVYAPETSCMKGTSLHIKNMWTKQLSYQDFAMALRARNVSRAFGKQAPSLNIQLVLLSWATGSISSGNLSAFDVTGSEVWEIAGDDIVTIIGNMESCLWQHHNFMHKTSSPKLRPALLNW